MTCVGQAGQAAAAGELSWSRPRALFALGAGVYAVTADGQRILVAEPNPEAQVREIHVVLNWDEELRGPGAEGW